jgi:hypothetical protein
LFALPPDIGREVNVGRIDDIEARAKAATEGPWEADEHLSAWPKARSDVRHVRLKASEAVLQQNDEARHELAELLGWREGDANWGWGKVYQATKAQAQLLRRAAELLKDDHYTENAGGGCRECDWMRDFEALGASDD